MFNSPLRYPGGKNKLAAFIAKICIDNNINGHYVEPYSGGASVALFLLIEGFVQNITINDRDRSIYAFWYSVLNETEQLCQMINNADFTIEEWRAQKEIQSRKDTIDLLTLGFSTFYLNRTNRSGIIKAGVMGGVEQTGNYLMDCRFNKNELIERIRLIASRRNNIRLRNQDAVELIDDIEQEQDENVIFYFDPPYYLKASSLYMNHYKSSDHEIVSNRIQRIERIKWIVSYDNVLEIQNLYINSRRKEFSFKHTAYQSREGKEVLFFSEGLILSDLLEYNPVKFKLKRKADKKAITYKIKNIY
jgi:DNA adenine methylase